MPRRSRTPPLASRSGRRRGRTRTPSCDSNTRRSRVSRANIHAPRHAPLLEHMQSRTDRVPRRCPAQSRHGRRPRCPRCGARRAEPPHGSSSSRISLSSTRSGAQASHHPWSPASLSVAPRGRKRAKTWIALAILRRAGSSATSQRSAKRQGRKRAVRHRDKPTADSKTRTGQHLSSNPPLLPSHLVREPRFPPHHSGVLSSPTPPSPPLRPPPPLPPPGLVLAALTRREDVSEASASPSVFFASPEGRSVECQYPYPA